MADVQTSPVEGMRRIVVASDGSEFSETAVREAVQWARRCGSKLYGVCVAEVSLGALQYAPDAVSTLDQEARTACEMVREQATAAGVDVEVIVHEGEEPHRHIIAEAEARNADAIVIGRRGRRRLMALLMGSATALTIGKAPCSVFVVPRTGSLSCERLLVATDGSEDSARAANKAIELAKCTGGSLIACAVEHGPIDAATARAHVDALRAQAEAAGVPAETAVAAGIPYVEIVSLAQRHGADLIVVASHGHTGLRKLLMGSTTERVVGLADRSVLVAR